MSRTMPHNAWLCSIVLVSLASAGAVHAATEPTQNDLQESAELQEAVAAIGSKARSELFPEATQPASGNDTALLYIFREDNMRLSGKRDVYMDETPIALLPRLSYTTAITEPGWHLMWGDVQPEWFEFQGGRTYLLRILDGGTSKDQWFFGDASQIQQGISAFKLQHVVLMEESLAKLRKKLNKYARARKRAGDRPESVYPAELTGIQYKNKPPNRFAGTFVGIAGRGTLRLTEKAFSYQSKKHELEIPMGDFVSVGLHGIVGKPWIAISYREQGSIQTAYFGPIYSFGAYNRMMLAVQHSMGIAPAIGALQRGISHQENGRYREAISEYNLAISIDPEYAYAYSNRGVCYSNLGEFQRAVADFDRAVQLLPQEPAIYSERGRAILGLQEYDRAFQDFDRSIELDPGNARWYQNRAVGHLQRAQYEEAIRDSNRAIELAPGLAPAFKTRGDAQAGGGSRDEACADWRRACDLGYTGGCEMVGKQC